MRKSNTLPSVDQEKTAERLTALRKEKDLSKEDVAEYLGVTRKTYHEWEKGKTSKSNGNYHFYYPAITSDNLLSLSKLYNVSVDYLLGVSDFRNPEKNFIGRHTGLSDKAIDGILSIKNESENLKLQAEITHTDCPYDDLAILNYFLEHAFLFGNILREFQNIVNAQYKVPVYFDEKENRFIAPSSLFEPTPNPETRWLNFARSADNPDDCRPIALTNDFFYSVALKSIEKTIHNLMRMYKNFK